MLIHRTFLLLIVTTILSYLTGYANSQFGSAFRRQAFQAAKRHNNIPRGQQPIKTYQIPDRGSNKGKMLTQHDYINNRGQSVSIRQDLPRKYGNPNGKGDQGHHYNAGSSGGKLKQHNYFNKFNSKQG